MFDIGFSELFVIGVVALIVIGPERLPRVARTAGHMLGRMQRYVNDVKADINREIELDELRKFKQEFETSAQQFGSSVRSELKSTEDALNSAAQQAASLYDEAVSDPLGTRASSSQDIGGAASQLDVNSGAAATDHVASRTSETPASEAGASSETPPTSATPKASV